MRVERRIIQTRASQFSTTLVQLLLSFNQDMKVETLVKLFVVNSNQLTLVQLLLSFDHDMGVKEALIQTVVCQLSCNSHKNSRFLKALVYFSQHSCSFKREL